MLDTTLYGAILGVTKPWRVTSVDPQLEIGDVVIRVETTEARLPCPTCSASCPRHDHRKRRWRHLPTCQYRTVIEVQVPRVRCEEHGVKQVPVPWAETNSSFTALFEAVVIAGLKEASISAVAEQLDGIKERAVRRGLLRRAALEPKRIGLDETSFQKRHEYVTVVNDIETGNVFWVADGRGKVALDAFYESLGEERLDRLEAVSMDMWKPYILSTAWHVPDAERKIAFDRFHVVKHLGDAVDKVRRQENRELMKDGDESLKGTKYVWLKKPKTLAGKQLKSFRALKDSALKTARAWALKEAARNIWGYKTRTWARKAWNAWLDWAQRSRIEPMVKVAKTIRYNLIGILNADVLGVTNARAESLNAKIQRVKRMACGFRNRKRFRTSILFHLGGLDLSPQLAATHTRS